MPNIEIHGFGAGIESRRLHNKIKEALQDKPFAKRVVITHCNDLVFDLEENNQPYLRIRTSQHEEELLAALQEAGINLDIEVQPIKRFIPKK